MLAPEDPGGAARRGRPVRRRFRRHHEGARGVSPMARDGAAGAGAREPPPPALAAPRLQAGSGHLPDGGVRVDVIASARTPLARAAALVVLAGLGIGLFLQMYARMAHPGGNDLGARLAAARLLISGENPYTLRMSQGHGPYPLTIDVLVIPLTGIPLGLAQILWFVLSVAALIGSLMILD